ncbi:MAG: ABC transporter substrate-binding protein [Clostridium sp.]
MKHFKKIISILLGILLILSLVGCSNKSSDKNTSKENPNSSQNESKDSHYPVTIQTYNYKKEPIELTFDKAPEKVFAVYQNSIETLLALGLEDKIIAAAGLDHPVKEEYKAIFEKVNYLEEFTPSKETVVMSEPDFILGWYSLFNDKNLGDVAYWNENGTNTYISLNSGIAKEKTIENEITDILNLGKIFNVEDKATELVNKINEGVEKTANLVKDKEKQNALVVEFFDDKISTYGASTLAGDMITKLGSNLLNPEGNNIGKEDLINLNPDCIFVVFMDQGDNSIPQQEVDKILKDESLQTLAAVKNKRIYPISLGEMYSSGIRTIDGINTFSDGLYGTLGK